MTSIGLSFVIIRNQNFGQRVLVECFLGRLKQLWSSFSVKWRLGEECFGVFLITSALVILDIIHLPLKGGDAIINEADIKMVLQIKKDERQRRANSAYKEWRSARLSGEGPYDPFMNGTIDLVLNQAKERVFKKKRV